MKSAAGRCTHWVMRIASVIPVARSTRRWSVRRDRGGVSPRTTSWTRGSVVTRPARTRRRTKASAFSKLGNSHAAPAVKGFSTGGLPELVASDLHKEVRFSHVVAPSEFDLLRAAKLRQRLGLPGQTPASALAFLQAMSHPASGLRDVVKASFPKVFAH